LCEVWLRWNLDKDFSKSILASSKSYRVNGEKKKHFMIKWAKKDICLVCPKLVIFGGNHGNNSDTI
jgi:hypothetical protein